MELFIIRVKFAIYYFLHFNTVRQVAARLRAKSAIYDFLVLVSAGQTKKGNHSPSLERHCIGYTAENRARQSIEIELGGGRDEMDGWRVAAAAPVVE